MRLVLIAALAVGMAAPVRAQDEGKIPPALPLVAHYADAQGRLLIGGGPEVEDVAAALGVGVRTRLAGSLGAVPLLAQGTVALAVLPREMTANERAASRRFAGNRPLAVPVMQGLTVYARRDAAGAIDARVAPLLKTLLADATLARLTGYARLDPAALAAARAMVDSAVVVPVPETPPGDTLPDGRIAIIGSDTLVTLLPDLLAAFGKAHPGTAFATDLRGSSLALPALTAGTSALAPTGREAWADDIDAFRQAKGYAPTRIRIAYASHGPRKDGKTPPAIYVNAGNPLARLSAAQIRRIFAAGAPGGDIATWSTLGLAGAAWQQAPIHVYGGRADGGFAEAVRQTKLDGLPFSARYRGLANGKAILQAVAADPLGIGYATWMDAGEAPAGVRLVPLGKSEAGPFVLPDTIVRRGAWPISMFFDIYVDRAPGRPLPSGTKALLRFLLSDAGQRIIAAHQDEEDGYVPLDVEDLASERRTVEAL